MFKVENLKVTYQTSGGDIQACDDISFEIGDNETVGIVGESGCGKSTVGNAILRLLPNNATLEADTLEFDGHDLLALSEEELRQIRWSELAMIPQSSMSAFDPVYTIKQQIIEAINVHRDVTRKEAVEEVRRLFELVSLDPARMNDYPHQLSGGMKQRATIAMALALDPAFILADEITTALDVITQDALLDEIETIKRARDMAMLFISHDIGVIQETCDRMFVMYAGKIVEKVTTDEFDEPYHPYTVGLQNAFPELGQKADLISIPGTPPKLENPSTGCRFAPRCPFAIDECRSADPPLEQLNERHASRCIRDDAVDTIRREGSEKATWQGMAAQDATR